jgi:type III secretory pathway lipoprotein EscJ
MINHEVSIIGFDGDINEVNAALVNAGIQTNPEEAESQSKESSVFVSPDQIGQAVQVINGLGYETDEDEDSE